MTVPDRYGVWAPEPERVRLVVDGTEYALTRGDDDWWRTDEVLPVVGARYGFRIGDDDAVRPDPRSRFQPEGVHGPSEVVDPGRFAWTDEAWTGRPEGTLDAAAAKLEHLVGLGVEFVELLPVNGVNGEWNWGYDGVAWYAVHAPYGGPDAYDRFVDRAHALGLGVIQDVVYNHLGPSGNYLPLYGPYLVQGLANTWGDSVNVEEPEVATTTSTGSGSTPCTRSATPPGRTSSPRWPARPTRTRRSRASRCRSSPSRTSTTR
jgi:maltooligosyltrehalose trehalohydrolase